MMMVEAEKKNRRREFQFNLKIPHQQLQSSDRQFSSSHRMADADKSQEGVNVQVLLRCRSDRESVSPST